jgi:ketosteroid isomerase-like protein
MWDRGLATAASRVPKNAKGRTVMDSEIALVKRMYDCFNARDIDGVLAVLADDVAWANGMDGGHVHGCEAVREYWTRQWTIVSPHVEPVIFSKAADGAILAEVQQSVRDVEGKPLEDQTHGLKDKTVTHIFRLQDGKVARFDIRD